MGHEARHDRQAAPVADAHVDHRRQAEHVEERQHGQRDVVGLSAEQVPGDRAVHVQLEVGELGALRLAGGPAGVDEHGRVLGGAGQDLRASSGGHERAERLRAVRERIRPGAHQVQRHTGHLAGLAGLRVQAREADQQRRGRIAQVVLDLGRHEQRIERQHDHPGLQRAEVGDQELGQVRQLDCHHLTGDEARVAESLGETSRPHVELAVRCRGSAHQVDGSAGRGQGGLGQDGRQVEAHLHPLMGETYIKCVSLPCLGRSWAW